MTGSYAFETGDENMKPKNTICFKDGGRTMNQTTESKNEERVLEAFDTLFNKRDYKAAEKFWSPNYIQHSAYLRRAGRAYSTSPRTPRPR